MRAYMAKRKGIKPQYDSLMERIEEAVIEDGTPKLIVDSFNLYPEVVKKLIKDGYDVLMEICEDGYSIYYEISWEKAKKGREGIILYIDETLSEISDEDEMKIDQFVDENFDF